ncbi:MAG TPA: hypothetical protein VN200_12270 [Rhodoglobus sp.]|nr:hypothetical protein [Rhodoglobus sp.]
MESKDVLRELDADRAALAARVRTPWWLAAGFGLIAACFVVSPAFDGNRTGVIIASVVLAVAMIAVYRRSTGVKLPGLGVIPWVVILSATASVLLLFSFSLGLASLDLHGWIAIPTVAAFAIGAGMTVLFTAAARRRMRRVR